MANRDGQSTEAFTLIELLAVIVIIVLLAALAVGVSRYALEKAAFSRAHADIAVIESGLDRFRIDIGRYPTSTQYRYTWYPYALGYRYPEARNSALLYQQLAGGNKGYLLMTTNQFRPFAVTMWDAPTCDSGYRMGWQYTQNVYTVIVDPWFGPYNYFCGYPSLSTRAVATNYNLGSCSWQCDKQIGSNTVIGTCNSDWTPGAYYGGQKSSSYDLWSYGPDHYNDEGTNDDVATFAKGRF